MDYRTNLRLRGALPKRPVEAAAPVASAGAVEEAPRALSDLSEGAPGLHPSEVHSSDQHPLNVELGPSRAAESGAGQAGVKSVHAPARRTADAVSVDQAIFTSVRSAASEGYRIVGASQGLRLDERQDITRRSPSHDSLTQDHARAVGMLMYRLPSGRFCISHSRLAGQEHTARGGQRVLTTCVVLSEEEFRRFDFHPLRVQASLVSSIPEGEATPSTPVIQKRTLMATSLEADGPLAPSLTSPAAAEPVARLLAWMLGGRRVVLCNAMGEAAVIDDLWTALPMSLRPRLSLSIGVKFSMVRQIRLTLLPDEPKGLALTVRGQDVELADARSLSGPPHAEFLNWTKTIGGLVRSGRCAEAMALCGSLSHRADTEDIAERLNDFREEERRRMEAERERAEAEAAGDGPS